MAPNGNLKDEYDDEIYSLSFFRKSCPPKYESRFKDAIKLKNEILMAKVNIGKLKTELPKIELTEKELVFLENYEKSPNDIDGQKKLLQEEIINLNRIVEQISQEKRGKKE